jgi:hypothetical protein
MLTPSAAFHILTIVRGAVLPSLFGVASLLLVAVFGSAAPGAAAADAKPAVDPGVAKLEGMTEVVRIWRTAPLRRRPLRAPTGRVGLRRRPAE